MIRVLVVDDDYAVRAALWFTLSDLGLAVSEATAGNEAFTQGPGGGYDVINIDTRESLGPSISCNLCKNPSKLKWPQVEWTWAGR